MSNKKCPPPPKKKHNNNFVLHGIYIVIFHIGPITLYTHPPLFGDYQELIGPMGAAGIDWGLAGINRG